ncbi:hypothetical protein M3P36_13600 [Altererythrobacter sp. KTW20L]|nr:hypothetical protein [Altererythrobacter sp. KTW20L]
MPKITSASVLGCILLFAGCTHQEEKGRESDSGSNLPALAADKSEPLLALADHLLANYFASDVATRPTVCIAVSDGREEVAKDPGDERELMMRYEALSPLSGCALIDGGWQDAVSGEPALVFSVHSFTCADAERCSGFASYMSGAQSTPSNRYTMEWDGSAWTFERDERLLGAE